MKNKIILLWCTTLCFFLCITGCSRASYLESEDGTESFEEEDEAAVQVNENIFVQVAGAVEKPGVYELSYGARVYEAIEAAGGLSQEADDTDLNQAAMLSDGQKLYVFKQGEASEQEAAIAEALIQDDGLININTASSDELKRLSGIGDTKADAIISYRQANGGFTSIEDLMKVDGIGEGTFNKLKDKITI